MNRPLLICVFFLVTALFPRATTASAVDITEDENGEPLITVVSSKPETTYSGGLGFRSVAFGLQSNLIQQYKSGERFCLYTPVLAMRNFTGYILLTKYWDADMELTLSNSDGEVISRRNVTANGKRMPYVTLRYENIRRSDIVSLCGNNRGTSKTVLHSVYLTSANSEEAFYRKMDNISATANITAQSIGRLQDRLSEIIVMSKADYSTVEQDYLRLMNISLWVNLRCTIISLMMLLCSGGSTLLIRRWFGKPESAV